MTLPSKSLALVMTLSSKLPGWSHKLGTPSFSACVSKSNVTCGGVMTETEVSDGAESSCREVTGVKPRIASVFYLNQNMVDSGLTGLMGVTGRSCCRYQLRTL